MELRFYFAVISNNMAQSLSEENYLKAIYHLSAQDSDKISLKAVASMLGNNPASVVDMLKKLTEKKLIQYDKKKGVKLTDKGSKIAILIVRRHRLWEVFLKEKLGYSWEEVHAIAEQLEHIQQEDLADRLDRFLGYPEYDPHGDPIPKSNGQLPIASKVTLSEVAVGKSCQVVGVKDTTTPFLQYLHQLNIGIGTKIKVVEQVAFDKSVVIVIGKDARTSVSQKFAESVLIS